MPRIRLRRKAICYFLVINIVLFVLYNLCVRWDKNVSLKKLAVNSSMKHFIQKLVPLKQKRVLTFEIGRPKPEGKPSVCRFTQSDGLELLAEKYLYPGDNPVHTKCTESINVKICAVSGSFKSFQVSCEHNPCGKIVKVGSLIKETGQIQWEDVNSSKLEKFIQEFVLRNLDQMFPFFYLKCSGNINLNTGIASQPTQIVSMPLAIPTNISHVSKEDINVNVNIIFLDAVSRRHLYRSLPKTIAAFRNMNLNPKSSSNVLDFELYQALRATPKETLSGFLKGKSTNFQNTTEKTILSFFKEAGYQTLWQEDECWKSDVGFSLYFGVHNSNIQNDLEKLKTKLKSESFDSLGLTHLSCLRNDVNNKENTLTGEICINGRLHHEYLFDYVMESLNNVKLSSSPLFAFTSISLGKEESGRKIQLIDNSLTTFVTKMAADKNTITILMSGYGNTFDMFPVQTMEGQYEKYNPFLFMVLPSYVAWRLGESKKKNLVNNQLRLISISDIHDMILSLVEHHKSLNETHNHGLFNEIDSNRNCANLDLFSSSLCICDGWNSKQQPNTGHYIIAEFALGKLNNIIANQYTNQKPKEVPFVTCERLKGLLVRNISQKRIENGYIITQIDIYVQRNELFRVNVKWHGDNNPAMEMALVNYERKHLINNVKQRSCSTYIDRDLCVCHVQSKEHPKIIPNWKKYGNVFGKMTKTDNRHNHCLYILSRDYGVSTVFEVANMCHDVQYNVRMNFELENMRTPGILPLNVTIPPKSIEFLTFVMPLHLTNPGTWEYEVDFSYSIVM